MSITTITKVLKTSYTKSTYHAGQKQLSQCILSFVAAKSTISIFFLEGHFLAVSKTTISLSCVLIGPLPLLQNQLSYLSQSAIT